MYTNLEKKSQIYFFFFFLKQILALVLFEIF